ncbi:MAG: 50S ribosomal protein L30 [Chloroflexi bacterium]|nr:50S ribosomal protein L30 [Chloroflexota bacterium]
MTNSAKKIQIKLVKSPISSTKRQRATLTSLGLRKINQVVEHQDSPSLRGMIDKVNHLVSVEEMDTNHEAK